MAQAPEAGYAAPTWSRTLPMTPLTLAHLETFLAIVRTGGVRRAAASLNLTQPAVTARIRNLETMLHCTLFERGAGGMTLTREGERLLRHAETFAHLAERVTQDLIAPGALERYLRIGVSETIAQCWLPDLVARLHAAWPRLEIELTVDVSRDLRERLLGREIDLAILLGPISEYTVDNIDLPGFDLAWYVAAGDTSDPAACLRRPVLSYARTTRPYRELKSLLLEHVGPEARIFPSSSLSAAFRLVEARLGVAALPRALGAAHVAAGRLREFDPGWVPGPLRFTASWLGEPGNHLVAEAARMAQDVAEAWFSDNEFR
jgi:DNA-binding transcriptional LysR family regulator